MMACVNNIDSNNAVAGRNRQIAKVRMPSLLMLFFDLVDDGLFSFNYNMASFYCFHRKEYEKKVKTCSIVEGETLRGCSAGMEKRPSARFNS